VTALADVAVLLPQTGTHTWEVFFLVHVGRGVATDAVSPAWGRDVCHFLYDAS
jgi:AdoMet-dependent heme synthase